MPNSTFDCRVIRIGMTTLGAGIIANFIPSIYLATSYGVMPRLSDLVQIWLMAFAAFGTSWIVQPISYFPMVGVAGSYISCLGGSVADIRIPAATMAQKATGAEAGTPQGDVMAMIGITASVILSVVIITIFTFIGASVIPLLPGFIIKSFDFILPAVFASVYAVYTKDHPSISVATIIAGLVMLYLLPNAGVPQWLISFLVIGGGIGFARISFLTDRKKQQRLNDD